jgi:hypothetical protein
LTTLFCSAGYATLFALVLGAGGRHGGPGWEAAALLVTLGYPLVLLVVVAHAVRAGREGWGQRGALPLLLLLAGLPGIAGMRAADGALHDRQFARHLPEMAALVARVPLGARGRARLPVDSLPAEVRDCCARVMVRRDAEGHLSATFLGGRSTAYLYDPSGARLERGISRGRWRSHDRLAPEWYRVVMF